MKQQKSNIFYVKNRKFLKKAQTETLGLVIIVVLLAVGLLFVVTFVILKPANSYDTTRTGVIATSTLNSILYTTTDCKDQTIKELLIDCAGYKRVQCGVSSCEYLNTILPLLLNKTLYEPQEREYFFEARSGDMLIIAGEECEGNKEPAYQPYNIGFGKDLTIRLDVCR